MFLETSHLACSVCPTFCPHPFHQVDPRRTDRMDQPACFAPCTDRMDQPASYAPCADRMDQPASYAPCADRMDEPASFPCMDQEHQPSFLCPSCTCPYFPWPFAYPCPWASLGSRPLLGHPVRAIIASICSEKKDQGRTGFQHMFLTKFSNINYSNYFQ